MHAFALWVKLTRDQLISISTIRLFFELTQLSISKKNTALVSAILLDEEMLGRVEELEEADL